jgi:hypothetical protein
MSRSSLVFIAALAVLLGPTAAAVAASLPSGTIGCTVVGDIDKPSGTFRLRFRPPISATPSTGRIRVTTYMKGTCDNSGVTGGKAPITEVRAHLVGSLKAGTSCATLTTAPVFTKLRLQIKWATVGSDNRLRTVAKSSVNFVDADWDADLEGLVLTSAPIKGAFGGSTSTVRISIDMPELFGDICQNPNAAIDGAEYGIDGNSSITIP